MFDLKKQNRIGIICLIFSVSFAFLLISKILLYKFICAGDTFWHYSNEINLVRSLHDFKGLFSCFPKGLGTPLLSFYQPLFYLIVAVLHLLSLQCVSLYFIHNMMVILLFSAYPLSVFYFSKSFGLSTLTSGVITIFSLFAISSCGHTIESCLSLGVHTQLIGTVFLPIIIGSLHRMSFAKKQIPIFIVFTISLLVVVLGHAVYILMAAYIIPLYLLCFVSWYGWKNFQVLLKKLVLSGIIVFILASFWLVPFIFLNKEYRYISPVERSGNSIYHSLTVKNFIQTLFKGELLDNTSEQSPLVEQHGNNKGLRWPDNSKFNRFKVFTIFSLAGFILFLLKFKKFRDFYFLFLFLLSIALFAGTDDMPLLKFLPFMDSFQNIRVILIIELMCSIFAGLLFSRLICFAITLLTSKLNHENKIKTYLSRAAGACLLFCLVCVLYPPLSERYQTSRKLIFPSAYSKTYDLQKGFSSIKAEKNYNTSSSRIFFNQSTLYRSFADCCDINTVIGLDSFVASNLAWLIGDVSHRVADSPALLKLLGTNYVVFGKDDKPANESIGYKKLYAGRYFDIYENPETYPLFFVPDKKPVLVYCSNKSWYFLNKIWLKVFLKQNEQAAHLIKATPNFSYLINPNSLSAIILLNFPDNDENKSLYYENFNNFIKSNGIIYSNKALWGLPVRKIDLSNEKNIEKILISSIPNQTSLKLTNIESNRYGHSFEYSGGIAPQFIIAKTVYYHMWKAFSGQNKKVPTFCVTPGYVGMFPEQPGGVIKLKYISSKLHIILFLSGIIILAMILLCRKKLTSVFKSINYIDNDLRKRKIFKFTAITVSFCLIIFSFKYFQQSYRSKIPLIYPLNNQKNLSPLEVTFHWNRLSNNENYGFQLSEDQNFKKLSASVNKRKSNFVICAGLKEDSKYYWRVKKVSEDKKSYWTKPHVFHTDNY